MKFDRDFKLRILHMSMNIKPKIIEYELNKEGTKITSRQIRDIIYRSKNDFDFFFEYITRRYCSVSPILNCYRIENLGVYDNVGLKKGKIQYRLNIGNIIIKADSLKNIMKEYFVLYGKKKEKNMIDDDDRENKYDF